MAERIYLYLILLSLCNRGYQPFTSLPCFSWLRVWYGYTVISSQLLHIDPGKVFLPSLPLCSLWSVQMIGYNVVLRSFSFVCTLLSGMPDLFNRNKILSGGDLSHYQVPHCIRVLFYFVWFVFIHHNFLFCFELCTYCTILDIYKNYKIWILLIIFCFIWNYWIIYFSTCLEVFWSVVS